MGPHPEIARSVRFEATPHRDRSGSQISVLAPHEIDPRQLARVRSAVQMSAYLQVVGALGSQLGEHLSPGARWAKFLGHALQPLIAHESKIGCLSRCFHTRLRPPAVFSLLTVSWTSAAGGAENPTPSGSPSHSGRVGLVRLRACVQQALATFSEVVHPSLFRQGNLRVVGWRATKVRISSITCGPCFRNA